MPTSSTDIATSGAFDWLKKKADQFGHWINHDALPYVNKAIGADQFHTDPSMFQMDMGPQNQFRDQQSQLAQMLFAQANGGGPNLAGQQERMATDRNIAQAYAMAQANPYDAGSARNAANNVAMANQDAAAQAAHLQMQQQLAAQSQLGGLLGGARGQDIGAAGAQLNANVGRQQIDSGAYGNSQRAAQGFVGGVMNGVGSLMGMGSTGRGPGGAPSMDYPTLDAPVPMASGGPVPYAHGGAVPSGGHSISIILPGAFAASGGQVPGRASVPGNSYANDTVPAKLSPGEIVLPKSVTEDPDAAEKAKLFVQAIQKRKAA